MGKMATTCAKRTRRTCEFALEDLRFCGLPFTLARFKEVFSRVLENVIREQSIHDIFDVPEWRVDVWEEHGDVIGGQARGNPKDRRFISQDCWTVTRPATTYLADTRAAAASSSGVRGTTGGLLRCKRLGEGRSGGIMSIGPEVLADGMEWALGVKVGVGEGGGG